MTARTVQLCEHCAALRAEAAASGKAGFMVCEECRLRGTPHGQLLELVRRENRRPSDREICAAYGFDRILYSFDDPQQLGGTHLRVERGEIVVETTVAKILVVQGQDDVEVWFRVFDGARAELDRQDATRAGSDARQPRLDELRAAVVATSIAMRLAEADKPAAPADDSIAEAERHMTELLAGGDAREQRTKGALFRWRQAVDALIAEGP